MKPVTVRCRAPEGTLAPEVSVEVHVGPGLPGLTIVGLVETSIKESSDRVRAALLNSGFTIPDRRIVISLAPADLPKGGSRYDLAIAIGILCASGQLPDERLAGCEFSGELALSGELRAVPGNLMIAMRGCAAGRQVILPRAAAAEVGLLQDARVLLSDSLAETAAYLAGTATLTHADPVQLAQHRALPDLADVAGQPLARRALEIAAAGGHHLLLAGPPGTGKSMLAQRLPSILPPVNRADALDTAALYSLRGIPPEQWPGLARPFRAPHHTASAPALAGGGSNPRPGEVSLAHNGVLFLDELPEFQRGVLEVLREPLEAGAISISRARHSVSFPARVQLIAAMNPCPCGYLGDPLHECRCTPDQVVKYQGRISGPFLDRIDMAATLAREPALLFDAPAGEPSATVRGRVVAARQLMLNRTGLLNSALSGDALASHCRPEQAGRELLSSAAQQLGLSRRATDRCLRVARTIADLAGTPTINATHLAEALSLRPPHTGTAMTRAAPGFAGH